MQAWKRATMLAFLSWLFLCAILRIFSIKTRNAPLYNNILAPVRSRFRSLAARLQPLWNKAILCFDTLNALKPGLGVSVFNHRGLAKPRSFSGARTWLVYAQGSWLFLAAASLFPRPPQLHRSQN